MAQDEITNNGEDCREDGKGKTRSGDALPVLRTELDIGNMGDDTAEGYLVSLLAGVEGGVCITFASSIPLPFPWKRRHQ